jgi:hypothetical protein
MSRTAIDKASDVAGVVAAARLREGFMRQRANAPNEERRGELDDAIGTLEVRFPELEDLPAGGAEKFARERGHGTGRRSPTHEGRSRGGPDAAPLERAANRAGSPKASKGKSGPTSSPKPAPAKRTPPAKPKATTATRRTSSRGAPGPFERRARARGSRAFRETGIPGAGASATSIVMSLLGGTVGLAAVFLLLSSAERGGAGGQALPTLLDGGAGFLRRLIAPEDFFGHGLSANQYAAVENPHGIAAVEEASLAAAGHSSLPVKPGIKVGGHPLLPRQLGFKK